tara:strand:- start:5440 stop:5583 length:144 start_codon:yes stop_codon:yes gene_type:complete
MSGFNPKFVRQNLAVLRELNSEHWADLFTLIFPEKIQVRWFYAYIVS